MARLLAGAVLTLAVGPPSASGGAVDGRDGVGARAAIRFVLRVVDGPHRTPADVARIADGAGDAATLAEIRDALRGAGVPARVRAVAVDELIGPLESGRSIWIIAIDGRFGVLTARAGGFASWRVDAIVRQVRLVDHLATWDGRAVEVDRVGERGRIARNVGSLSVITAVVLVVRHRRRRAWVTRRREARRSGSPARPTPG